MKKVLSILLTLMMALSVAPFAAQASDHSSGVEDPKGIIFEHLGDTYGWAAPFSHSTYIPLPIIVRDCNGDWHVFSSARVEHGATYDGFKISSEGEYKGKLVGTDANGAEYRPLDISITKNVAALFISALVVVLCVMSIYRWYKKNPLKAPRKGTAFLELIVEFVYSSVVRPTLGKNAKKFGPYLLTVFFLILIMNLLGLIVIFPGGANLTGNIAVTLVLALFTFFITNVFGTKHYWKEVFWPDVPLWLKFPLPIMPMIELFGLFTKPAALTIRLFANMMGGHIIVLVLTLLIFIFGAFGAAAMGVTTVVSVAFSLFMLLLDTLVSFIQAFVFTMLSALFISMAQEGHGEEI
ncbi:MAG: F0F1 ATP synthase subunit A [Muribaculaceae bacterium]|nr:F0F1 ATP synthase subunit A [Muribaculaceae bacterium]MEE1298203.1 F0F1 ATP synthase subunit A [Muribaculaceae bacterium]